MLSKPKVLIVDDRPENIFAMKKTLKKVDADLFTATSGNEALGATLNNDFALVLLDVQMPGMNGYEVAEILRKEEATKHIPIIFITAIDRDEEREIKGYDSGAVDYIFKPINARVLLGKVNVFIELCQSRQKLQQYNYELELKVKKRTKQLVEHRDNLEKLVELAENANRLKDQFLDMVSHELRTPLTTMLGPLGIIIEELKGLNLPENAKDAEKMAILAKESADLMLLIVEDLLCVTRLRAGKIEFHCEPKSVASLVRQGVEVNAGLTEKHGAEFVLGYLPDTSIMVDPQRFAQIMTNLLSNAAKYGITEKNKQVTVSSVRRENTVRVLVEDKGPGIPKDFQPYVFDKFAIADSSDVREKGGLGLGMLITKGLVECMGGEIGLESKPGMGATFWVQFPELKIQEKRGISNE